jgi:hypothetical protein
MLHIYYQGYSTGTRNRSDQDRYNLLILFKFYTAWEIQGFTRPNKNKYNLNKRKFSNPIVKNKL